MHAELREALDFTDGMASVYVAEFPDASTGLIHKFIGIEDIPWLNAASHPYPPRSTVAETNVRKAILERNQLDLAIFDYAVSPLGRRSS